MATGASDHGLRAAGIDEMHARPSPVIAAPAEAVFVALRPERRSERDRPAELAHLRALADAWGLPPPADGTHWTGTRDGTSLTWESHTEFVSLLLWGTDDSDPLAALPEGWLAGFPGLRIAAARFSVREEGDDTRIVAALNARFRPESLAVSRILDDALVVAGDFRPDAAGEMHFAVFARPGCGPGRIGRVVQRLREIETYRAMAMLGLSRARELGPELTDLEARLSAEVSRLGGAGGSDAALHALLDLAARMEQIETRTGFRFPATEAYEKLVLQRIAVLREARFEGRQSFAEFMSRRFDPAMRTVSSTQRRVQELTARAARAAELLRTRVEVERAAQNQALLASMDRRSDQALRLQRTVEGLSVVAIAYYGVGLVMHVVDPFAERLHLAGPWLGPGITLLVVAVTWVALGRIRRRLH